MHHALLHDGSLTVDATPGTVLRTTADAFDVARTHPGLPEALAAAGGLRPAVAALAIGLLGATHGAIALPHTAFDFRTAAARLAHDLLRGGGKGGR